MSDPTITVLVGGPVDVGDPVAAPLHPRVESLGHVTTGNEAIARVLTDLPDVLLLDVRIGDPDARAVCRRIREWAPATRVLAVTPEDDERAYTTLVAGAAAVTLAGGEDRLADEIADVARGESVLPSRAASRLVNDIDAWAHRSADPLFPPPTLTATEREVLTRLGRGTGPDAIAAEHSVTRHLVNLHAGFAVAKLHRYVLGAERIASER